MVFDFNRTIYDPDKDRLVEGANAVLQKLSKNIPMALYCKKGEGGIDEKISEFGLEKFFKKIVFVENKTPQDLIEIAKEFKVKTSDILVIGDRIQGEIKAAKQAGCKTIWFKQGKFANEEPTKPEEQPDYTILKLEEVLNKI